MTTFMRRILPILVIVGVLVSLTPGKVTAQSPWFSINPSSGPAGVGVIISGGGSFTPDQKGQILWDDGSYLGDAIIDGKGYPSGSFYIPGTAGPGVYDIILETDLEKAAASFTVIANKPTDTQEPVPIPYIKDFSLNPQTILAGDCATLYWSVSNAQSVMIFGDFGSQPVDASGSLKVCPPITTTYRISADGYKGADPPTVSASRELTVISNVTDTPSSTPSMTPNKFPGYINTPTFTPSRTPTKFPGLGIMPSITRTSTNALESPPPPPSGSTQITGNNIAPMQPIFDNQMSILGGSVSRVQRGSPCSGLNLGGVTTVIGFDDAPVGRLTDWYGGVTFGSDRAFVGIPPVSTHSGNHAVSSSFDTYNNLGSVNQPILVSFTHPVIAVGMYLGREAPSQYANESVVAVLTGYGATAGGTAGVVAQNEIDLPGQPTNIDRCLSISAPTGQPIRSVTLEYINSAGYSVYDRRWMDDLTFVYQSYVSSPDRPPVATITRPESSATITTDAVNLQFDITEDIGLNPTNGVTISINGSSNLINLPFVRDVTNPVHYQATTSLLRSFLRPFNTNTVRVVATDTAGQTGEAQVAFNFQPASAVDIIVEEVEVTQATQYFPDNHIPMYTNKPTLVRVYARILSGPTTLNGISGALCLGITRDSGCSNPIHPFSPVTLHSVASTTLSDLRNDLNLTLNFLVPMDWLRASEDPLNMTVYVNYNQENVQECCYENNFRSTNVYVSAGKLLNILILGINANGYHADLDFIGDLAAGLKDVYPVSRVQLYHQNELYYNLGTWDFCGTPPISGWANLSARLWILAQTAFYSTPDLHWFGLVPYEAISEPDYCSQDGIGVLPGPVAAGGSTSTDILGTIMRTAHELGHNYGLHHASSYGGADDPDPNYPDANGNIDQVGVNVRTSRLYRTTAGEVMSYHTASERWISAYNYEALSYDINTVAYNPFRSLRLISITRQTEPVGYLLGSGSITQQGIAFTSSFFKMVGQNPAWDGLPSGPYTMELQDVKGKVLFSRAFNVWQIGEAPSDLGEFSFIVPWFDGTTAVVFKHDGVEIGRRTASPHVPEVTVLSPNGGETWGGTGQQIISWTADDPDGEPLTYLVQSTCDNGKTWNPLGSELTETRLTVNLANMPGGKACMIRVLASDGINTGEGVSKGLFTVADKPPELFISNPQENNKLSPGWPVILLAQGTDVEDGSLPVGAMTWTSNRDGNLGSGDYLIASTQNMSPGDHTITLTGVDSNGQTASYTTQINLVAPPAAAVAESVISVKPLIPLWVIFVAGIVASGLIILTTVLIFLISRWKRRTNARP
jgi:hypothetical protein